MPCLTKFSSWAFSSLGAGFRQRFSRIILARSMPGIVVKPAAMPLKSGAPPQNNKYAPQSGPKIRPEQDSFRFGEIHLVIDQLFQNLLQAATSNLSRNLRTPGFRLQAILALVWGAADLSGYGWPWQSAGAVIIYRAGTSLRKVRSPVPPKIVKVQM